MLFMNTIAMFSKKLPNMAHMIVIGNRYTETFTGILHTDTHRGYTHIHTETHRHTHIQAFKVNEYITGQSLCLLTLQWYPQGNQVSSHIVE